MARICFLVPIVIVAGVGEERSCLNADEVGRLGAGGFSSGMGFGWGFVSSISVLGYVRGRKKGKLTTVLRQD